MSYEIESFHNPCRREWLRINQRKSLRLEAVQPAKAMSKTKDCNFNCFENYALTIKLILLEVCQLQV